MLEADLIHRAARGEEEAFQVLYRRYRDPLFRFAFRLTGSAETAEDLAHDCFLSLLRSPGRFSPADGTLRAYLYAAVRNLAWKRFRDSSREASGGGTDPEPAGDEQGPFAELSAEEEAALVREAVLGLPALQREVIVLVEYEGLSLSETASVVGTEVGTVKARLHRARQNLRSRLLPVLRGRKGSSHG